MNEEELQLGKKYNVQMEFTHKEEDGLYYFKIKSRPWHYVAFRKMDVESCVFPLSAPENGIKNTEDKPKYDPCRKFRKGDKVRLVEWQGRLPFDCENYEPETAGQLCIVAEDEDEENAYMLHVWKLEDMESELNDDEREWLAFPLCSIELVTPVEELEPYIMVELCNGGYAVYKDSEKEDNEVCIFWNDAHPHAKAAAEAERDRLNAEYRKEQA